MISMLPTEYQSILYHETYHVIVCNHMIITLFCYPERLIWILELITLVKHAYRDRSICSNFKSFQKDIPRVKMIHMFRLEVKFLGQTEPSC